jgi:DNA invertase Pin-like site-specific DNA recombinase
MKYGYARVSTDDQKTDLQIAALKKTDCEYIFTDTATGASSKRPELTRCLEIVRAGDTLVVWKLDRLGRSLPHLVTVLAHLQKQGVAFLNRHRKRVRSRLMGHILAALAEFERALIVERTQAGLKAAKNRGVKLGHKPSLSEDQRKNTHENCSTVETVR